jgi:hypothetical protein
MARAWRIEYEGAYYLLLSRGNEHRDILLYDEDRSLFLYTIKECCGEWFEIGDERGDLSGKLTLGSFWMWMESAL